MPGPRFRDQLGSPTVPTSLCFHPDVDPVGSKLALHTRISLPGIALSVVLQTQTCRTSQMRPENSNLKTMRLVVVRRVQALSRRVAATVSVTAYRRPSAHSPRMASEQCLDKLANAICADDDGHIHLGEHTEATAGSREATGAHSNVSAKSCECEGKCPVLASLREGILRFDHRLRRLRR